MVAVGKEISHPVGIFLRSSITTKDISRVELLIIWVGEIVLEKRSSFIGQGGEDRQEKAQTKVAKGWGAGKLKEEENLAFSPSSKGCSFA